MFPIVHWIRTYRRDDFAADFSAGCIVAVVLIPQGLAYALLAGLPPVTGLYVATLPLIAYSLMATSRHLAVGPFAVVSIMTFEGVSRLAEPGSPEFVAYSMLLTATVGAMKLAMGFLRMGFLSRFLSQPVISGFISAAAMIIAFSQLPHLLAIDLAASSGLPALVEAIARAGEIHWPTAAMGAASIAAIVTLQRRAPRWPGQLLVVLAGIVTTWIVGPERLGLAIVGHIPQGFPPLRWPAVDGPALLMLAPTAGSITLVSFTTSIAIARSIAARENYRVDANQELLALGAANVAAAVTGGLPVTASLSRTALNYGAGARTGMASIVTALLIIVILAHFGPLFYYLPTAVLAAVVVTAVYRLIDFPELRRLWHLQRTDAWSLLVTFAATLFIGVEEGIVIGIAFSLFVFVWRSAHPQLVELGYVEGDNVFRNVSRFPEARTFPHTLIVRLDAPLYFANRSLLESYVTSATEARPDLRWIILDLSGVNDMDAAGLEALQTLVEQCEQANVRLFLTGMKGPLRDMAARAGWTDGNARARQFPSIDGALQAIGFRPTPLRTECPSTSGPLPGAPQAAPSGPPPGSR